MSSAGSGTAGVNPRRAYAITLRRAASMSPNSPQLSAPKPVPGMSAP
jgi:hypothetical protein